MITWGISSESHNAALSVFVFDTLLFASESERFSGVKNDPQLNDGIISHALQYGKPSRVCWYENPYKKQVRQLLAGQGWQENFKKYIDAPIYYCDHHYSHACAGFFTSRYNDSAIVVIDAIGEFQTLTIWEAEGNKIKLKYQERYPQSVGLWYSAMTQRCGLKPNEEEYILMGMSAYGDPDRLREDIRDLTHLNLHCGCESWRPDLTTEQDMYDIAAATQDVYSDLFESTLKRAKKLVKSKNLVLMGGCALNCAANPIAYKYFDDVWIMPAPGDSGSSIGAVLAYKKKHIEWKGPYLGYDIKKKASNLSIVNYLLNHQICGVARGRAEFGPRALGNRSLFADPRGSEIKDRVNEIKLRQKFRPFAPVIMEEFASEYFDLSHPSPYMQHVVKCLRPDEFPAIVHVDGTSRVQTVNPQQNPDLYELLRLFYGATGCPMLLNTSLNVKGKPMVNNEADCIKWQEVYGVRVFS